jgi:hypothetical protein
MSTGLYLHSRMHACEVPGTTSAPDAANTARPACDPREIGIEQDDD